MKKKIIPIIGLFALILFMSGCLQSKKNNNTQSINIDGLIEQMTLEEKIRLVVGGRKDTTAFFKPIVGEVQYLIEGSAGNTSNVDRLEIPRTVLADGPAGLRITPIRKDHDKTYYCTAYPIATALASSWNTELLEEAGRSIGNEVKEYGVDVLLAPGMNIHRYPLAGRNFEYYSEDPLVSGKMAAAMVRGVQSNGVGTSIKHFTANNQETSRLDINTHISQRALREIYLKGFEIAIRDSDPWTVMSAYNLINGVPASQNRELLIDVLRNDWGYEGLVMTDWSAGVDAVEQMKAGNELLMPGWPKQYTELLNAVREGRLDEKIIDRNLKRILEYVIKTPSFKKESYSNDPDMKAHAKVSRELAGESMVLLKNDSKALPLENIKTIAAFGFGSYDFIAGGTGSGDVNKAYTVSLVEGLQNAGYTIAQDLSEVYKTYMAEEKPKVPQAKTAKDEVILIKEMDASKELIEKSAASSDVALITIGRVSGEFRDRREFDERYGIGDYYLTQTEKDLIKNVTETFKRHGKKTVLVLNIGGPVELTDVKDIPDAILLAWQPGLEAGNAVADVLSGKVNPSGKLTTTFLANINDASGKSFPGTPIDRPTDIIYNEGIYVGYRYYDTYGIKPLYEFGYGLSYTEFQVSDMKLKNNNGKFNISVSVVNKGDRAGKEVVQIYVSAPAGKLDKPHQELRAFGKTKLLKPGEKQTMDFTLDEMDIASFDESVSAWIVEPGKYVISAGASSRDIRVRSDFSIDKEIMVKKVSNVLAPEIKIAPISKN